MDKEEFKNKLDKGESVNSSAFTYYKYENCYYYICGNWNAEEDFEKFWKSIPGGPDCILELD